VAEIAVARPQRPPFWRNVRVLRVLGQVLFVIVLFLVLRELYLNLEFQIRRLGLDLSFDFLQRRAGFGIGEGITYSPNQSFLRAYQVGLVNTIRVASVGILLTSILGLVIGVARLSPNWLLRKFAQVYVEAIRNTPVLIQIIFMAVLIGRVLPSIGGGLSLGGVAFLSNRGAAIPWLRATEGSGTWGLFLVGGVAAAALTWRWRTRVNERTGRAHHRVLWSLGTFVVVAAAGYVAAGNPIRVDVPEALLRGYRGGFQMSPQYAALLAALVIYTSAFVAEIVRGSILAVPKGQKEAAEAIGLTPAQQLRFVVLPQALRIAIPPINSQYLNLAKNSSLAVAIAYPDLVSISRTIMNQSGRATQMLLIVMGSYLVMSLFISFFMNILNRAVSRRGEQR